MTRVAGSNPAIWGDIFSTNREAVAEAVKAVGERLREAAELIRAGDRDSVAAWHAAAAESRRKLLEADLTGGPLTDCESSSPTAPARSPSWRWRWARRGSTSRTWRCTRRPT